MTRVKMRIGAFSLTMLAAGVFYVAHATVAPVPLAAAVCCTQCENAEAAGYAACAQASHSSCGGLQDCYDQVDAQNWQFCWAHCSYSYCGGGCSYTYTCNYIHEGSSHSLLGCGYSC